jgi:purine-binding chemotaxis protein CheW
MGFFDGDIEKQYFIFNLGNRSFGISLKKILRVVSVEKVFKAPLLSDFMLGFIIYKGEPIPYLSLKRRLGLKDDEKSNVALLVKIGEHVFGLSIDGDYKVIQLEVPPNPMPPKLKGVVKKYFEARAEQDDRRFIILNANALTVVDNQL